MPYWIYQNIIFDKQLIWSKSMFIDNLQNQQNKLITELIDSCDPQ